MLFRSNDTATTEIYTHSDTLSLHDVLPITSRSSAGTSSLLDTGLNSSLNTAPDNMKPAPDIRDGSSSRGTTRA